MKSLSILIADDENAIRILLQRWLVGDGHTVMAVGSATEASKLMKRIAFDLIITDVIMPDGDGLQLITDYKQAQPEVRILAISGGGRYMESTNCLKIARGLGAHAAVLKPFSKEQLQEGMDAALAVAKPVAP